VSLEDVTENCRNLQVRLKAHPYTLGNKQSNRPIARPCQLGRRLNGYAGQLHACYRMDSIWCPLPRAPFFLSRQSSFQAHETVALAIARCHSKAIYAAQPQWLPGHNVRKNKGLLTQASEIVGK